MENMISFERKITNGSEYFILVGNCNDVISHHKTLDDAVEALNKINVADSK